MMAKMSENKMKMDSLIGCKSYKLLSGKSPE